MKNLSVILFAAIFLLAAAVTYAGQKTSADILKEGLLGAGAGTVGGLVSGAKGGDVWKGALAGAGVNIVGGALLDAISGEQVNSVDRVQQLNPQDAYSQGYQDGFNNGYKQGYTQGYKEGVKEGVAEDVEEDVKKEGAPE